MLIFFCDRVPDLPPLSKLSYLSSRNLKSFKMSSTDTSVCQSFVFVSLVYSLLIRRERLCRIPVKKTSCFPSQDQVRLFIESRFLSFYGLQQLQQFRTRLIYSLWWTTTLSPTGKRKPECYVSVCVCVFVSPLLVD